MENGVINPRIHPNVASRKIRNGVGINKQGNAVFLLSQQATNFYDFACYAKAKLNVEQLLYLDGTISHIYMKGGAIPWQRYPFCHHDFRRVERLSIVHSRRPDKLGLATQLENHQINEGKQK